MNLNRGVFFVLLILCFGGVLLAGQTPKVYFVDSEFGKDDNCGTHAQMAWKSLEQVNRHVFVSGDSLLFKKGTRYTGMLNPQLKQTSDKLFVISSYGTGDQPVIVGNGVMPAALWIRNLQKVKVSDLSVTNTGKVRIPGLAGVKVELNNFGIAPDITLQSLTVSNVNGSLVKKLGGGAGILIENKGDTIKSAFLRLTIENCTIRKCERNGIIFSSYWSRKSWFPNLKVIIRGNLIEEVPGDGIVPVGCDSALIEFNVMRKCTDLLPLGEAAAGIWPWSCDYSLIQFNEVSDHKAPWDGQGFDSDWNSRNTIIQYNYSHDNDGGFVLICNDGGVNLPYSIGNLGTIIRYNVSVNDGIRKRKTYNGVFSPVVHVAGPCKDTWFYNNLIVQKGVVSDTTDNSIISVTDWKGVTDSVFFMNNVFVSETLAGMHTDKLLPNMFTQNLFMGRFAHIPDSQMNILSDSFPEEWINFCTGVSGFNGLRKYQIWNAFPGIGKGASVIHHVSFDFFGRALHPGALNIGIDQSTFVPDLSIQNP